MPLAGGAQCCGALYEMLRACRLVRPGNFFLSDWFLRPASAIAQRCVGAIVRQTKGYYQ
jgi:hypothetical protein